MNAPELIEAVRQQVARLALHDDGRLILQGSGQRLPEQLRHAISERKAEVVAALRDSQPLDRQRQANILAGVRRHHPAWRELSDDDLLCLVDFAVYWKGLEDGREARS